MTCEISKMAHDPIMADQSSLDLVVDEENVGERLDRFLTSRIEELTRVRVQALIKAGHVTSSGEPVKDASRRVKAAEQYHVFVPEPVAAEPVGEAIALDTLYEDDDLVVINKPAGLVVHPGAGHDSGTLVHALINHCGSSLSGIGGVKRPGIVHRLDRDTTGVLVVAKNDRAHLGLSAQFAAHGRDGRMSRTYIGLCWKAPAHPKGTVDARIGRSSHNRRKMAVVGASLGRSAVTHYNVERRFIGSDGEPVAALLRLRLETGRTHQIRVHMAHIQHPLLGDPVYGAGFKSSARTLPAAVQETLEELSRQALHAAELSFEHPISGERMAFQAPVPADLASLIGAFENA